MKLIDSMEGIMKGTQQASTCFPIVYVNNLYQLVYRQDEMLEYNKIPTGYYLNLGKSVKVFKNIIFMFHILTTLYWRLKLERSS